MKKALVLLITLTLTVYIAGDAGALQSAQAEEAAPSVSVSYDTLLTDMLDAYNARLRIDQDVAALDDEIARRIADHWKQVYLDPDYRLYVFGKDDPSLLSVSGKHAFVVLGYALRDGEMTEELRGRCDAAAAAARAFPDSILVCTGGATGSNNPDCHTEAGLMKAYLSAQGISPERIFTDEAAMTTSENALNTFYILMDQGVETITIVTSSYHQRWGQVLYNAVGALFGERFGYTARIVGNYCYDAPHDMNGDDAWIAISQLRSILRLPLWSEPAPDAEEPVDYARMENWAYFAVGEEKPVDLFLICPAVDVRDELNMSLDDKEMMARFLGALNMERGIYEDSARMYAPYYRQASVKASELDGEQLEICLQKAYSDVSAAFRWYLENENAGRPIILAGFSQGADMCLRLMREYFGNEELLSRLVTVYAIGWRLTEDMTASCPQIRPAQSATDLGTVICFDCEAPEVTETFISPAGQKMLSINPLSWRTDSAPASKDKNLGACFTGYDGQITREEAQLCGCYIDEARGVLKVTDIDPKDYPARLPALPQGAYHIYDYQFFFRNLQKNIADRVSAYLTLHNPAQPEEAPDNAA